LTRLNRLTPGAAAVAFLYLAPSITAGVRWLRGPLGIRDRTQSGEGVALTFDDGPHPQGTQAVLEILRDAKAPATFFLVGEQVARRPGVAAEIAAAGHEIALHCHRHRSLLRLTPRQVRDDLDRAYELIAEATGREPRLYRPPYGVLNTAALATARQRGWETVLWARDGHDWEARATADSIAERITRGVEPGDVLLLHDSGDYSAPASWRKTVAALPRILERLDELGLKAEPVGYELRASA
jgi:peptidoglycan/xylan/chitin deacetylase (PgdA/CDA1 family)